MCFIVFYRRLSYSHLAQIKFILPESIQIDKILVHDETTLLMKPDLKITLLFDVIKDRHEQSPHSALRQIFASRLLNYCIMHLEVMPFHFIVVIIIIIMILFITVRKNVQGLLDAWNCDGNSTFC